jgi:CheY-like chemotaxis protein
MADPTQIHQIVMNLATNAYHAMEETGGTLTVTLKKVRVAPEPFEHSMLIPGEYACLTVADTGIGIEKDVLARVFDPYFTTRPTGKGTGLGLAVVHGIVKSYRGDIRIYSEPGKGTECRVYLPVIERTAEPKIEEAIEPICGGTERILVVDDEEVIVRMEQMLLERLGYQVTARTASIEALEAFKANPGRFDLIVTDMTMPNMTGIGLAREVKKIKNIPVIVCTGFSEQINEENFKALGIDGYVLKPLIRRDIAETIRKVLDESVEG